MKINEWTLGLAAVGAVSLASAVQADEVKLVPLMTAVSSTTLSGYVDTSVIWRPGTGADAVPVGRLFDVNSSGQSKQDGFNLNVVSLSLDKALEEGKWSAGYHVQTLIGPDAVGRGALFASGANEVGINEAYIKLRAPVGNGLDFQIGEFGSFAGYESFDSVSNPNYSRSFGKYLEPITLVGATATYTFSPVVSASLGVANSYGPSIDGRAAAGSEAAAETAKYYLGKVILTAPDGAGFLKGSTLVLAYSGGAQEAGAPVASIPANEQVHNYYAGATVNTPLKELSLGAAFDYQDGGQFAPASAGGYFAHALAGYITYAVTDNFHLNGRADWGQGSAGSFMNLGALPFSAVAAAAAAKESFLTQNEDLLGLTLTADYKVWANVTTRLEARWDHSLNGLRPYDNALPNANSTLQKNETTLALNVIYQF